MQPIGVVSGADLSGNLSLAADRRLKNRLLELKSNQSSPDQLLTSDEWQPRTAYIGLASNLRLWPATPGRSLVAVVVHARRVGSRWKYSYLKVFATCAVVSTMLLATNSLAQQGWQKDIDIESQRIGACDAAYYAGLYCPQRSGQYRRSQIDQFVDNTFKGALALAFLCGFSSRDGSLLPCPKLVYTGGRVRIVGLANGERANISSTPYPKTMGDLLFKLPPGTSRMTLADKCNSQTCPIYLILPDMNDGIGWIDKELLAVD